jgi:hypothetical protein
VAIGGTRWLRHRETPAEPSASLAPGTATVRP